MQKGLYLKETPFEMKIFVCLIMISCTTLLVAQDCTPWFPFTEGAVLEYTIYNKKDKPTQRIYYEVKEIEEQGDSIITTVYAELFKKKKDEPFYICDFEVSCRDGAYRSEFSNYINPTMNETYGSAGVTVVITGEDLVLPEELSVGMDLPDITRFMETNFGVMGMKAEMNFTDRKVVEKVDVETPVKTFSAYKITGRERIKMSVYDRKCDMVYYYAEGYGMVKSEAYPKQNKPEGYMLLTGFSK